MLSLRNRDNGDGRQRPEVKEVQDEFLNVYRRALDNDKEWVKRFTEERKPQTQKDLSVLDNTDKQVETLLKVLQDKFNNIDSIDKGVVSITGQSVKSREIVDEFGKSFDIIKPYNDIIRQYLNPEVNDKTRDEIRTKLQQIVPLVNQIIYVSSNVIDNNFLDGVYTPQKYAAGRRYLNSLISTLLALLVIQKNTFRGNYSLIDKPQLDIQYTEWLSSLPVAKKNFVLNVENKFDRVLDDAGERRIKLMEQDRGFPLSENERLKLHNALFGVSSVRQLTPEEQALFDEEDRLNKQFSLDRQRDLEGRQTETQLRVLAGLQPVEIPQEQPLAQPQDEITGEDVAQVKIAERVKKIETTAQNFIDEAFKEYDKKRRALNPTNTLGSQAVQKKNGLSIVNFLVNYIYKEGYKTIMGHYPTMPEVQNIQDTIINVQTDRAGIPNLTEASINGVPFFRQNVDKRTDFYDSINTAYDEIVADLNNVMNGVIDSVESGENIVSGNGKPHNKINPAIHYNDYNNDPYLIH